jgi:hypothetical protein
VTIKLELVFFLFQHFPIKSYFWLTGLYEILIFVPLKLQFKFEFKQTICNSTKFPFNIFTVFSYKATNETFPLSETHFFTFYFYFPIYCKNCDRLNFLKSLFPYLIYFPYLIIFSQRHVGLNGAPRFSFERNSSKC